MLSHLPVSDSIENESKEVAHNLEKRKGKERKTERKKVRKKERKKKEGNIKIEIEIEMNIKRVGHRETCIAKKDRDIQSKR